MILKDVESLEYYGYTNPYSYTVYRERPKARVYDEGVLNTLERLDKIPVALEWVSTKDKPPAKEGWYLCTIGHKILPLYYVEELDESFFEQYYGRFNSQVVCWIYNDIDYWADFSTLPIPKE